MVWGNLYDRGSVNVLDLRTRATSTLPGSDGMMGPKCAPDGSVLAAKEWSQGYFLYRPQTAAVGEPRRRLRPLVPHLHAATARRW